MPGLTNVRGVGLAFQANDPYVTDFTLAILRFQENGFLANLERKWWESSSGCPKEQHTGKNKTQGFEVAKHFSKIALSFNMYDIRINC